MEDFKAAEPQVEAHSDAQEGVVDSPESQNGGYAVHDDHGEVVDPQQEAGTEASDPDNAGQEERRRQSRGDNAAIRAARIAARREAEAEISRRTDEDISKSGVINPYTNKPFSSVKEFREYGEKMRQAEIRKMAKESGRTEEEVAADMADRDYLRKLRKQEEEKQKAERAREEREAFIRKDVQDFVRRHPDVDLEKLENNKSFLKYCGSRFGREPLGDLYEDYLEVVGEAGKAAVAKQAGRSERSTGGGSAGGGAITPSQQKALDAWNAANPDMQMTAKEFLKRSGK